MTRRARRASEDHASDACAASNQMRPGARRKPQLISVVLPVLNGEPHLREQFEALASQTYRGAWEVVLADNGSTDRSRHVAQGFADRLPALTVADAGWRRGLNHARNTGTEAARGDFVAFCDADDVVDRDWLMALAEAAQDADMVGGHLDFELLNEPVCRSWIPPIPDWTFPIEQNFLPGVPGGNCGMWASVARALRWNDAFVFGSSDIEFSWRAQLGGYRVVFAREAVVHRRCRPRIRDLARQWYLYGESGPQLYREFRDAGMPPARLAAALGTWCWLLLTMPRVIGSRGFRGHWVRIAARSLGSIVGSMRCRVMFIEAPELPVGESSDRRFALPSSQPENV